MARSKRTTASVKASACGCWLALRSAFRSEPRPGGMWKLEQLLVGRVSAPCRRTTASSRVSVDGLGPAMLARGGPALIGWYVPPQDLMVPKRIRDRLLGAATLFALACLFIVRSSTRRPNTLIAAIVELMSADPHDVLTTLVVALPWCLVVLLTVCLPPLLWLELAVAPRPFSRWTRSLLIVQGLVGLFAGIPLTFLLMAIGSMQIGWGVTQSDDSSAGFYVILAAGGIFSVASLILGLRRPPTPDAAPLPPPPAE